MLQLLLCDHVVLNGASARLVHIGIEQCSTSSCRFEAANADFGTEH